VQQQPRSTNGMVSSTANRVKKQNPETLLKCMRVFNIICSICVMIAACSTLAALRDSDCGGSDCSKLSFGVVSFYAFVFGFLLFWFELRCGERSTHVFVHNFGFMYAHRGKSLLILFISTLVFSSIQVSFDRWVLNLAVGVIVALNGIFYCFVYCMHPTFSEVDMWPGKEGIHASGSTSRGIDIESNSMSQNNASANMNQSAYEFGSTENLGPTYDRYNESPFAVQETTPQVHEQYNESPFATQGTAQQNQYSDSPFADPQSSSASQGSSMHQSGQPNDSPFSIQ